jgi:hypothetical protein
MTGIQIIGRDAVLQRFEALNCDAWALYQGKQFIVGGTGSEDLDQWLTSFEASGTTATYLLRVYDCSEKPTSSTGNTDYVACMGFKLIDNYEGMGIAGHSNSLMQRLGAVEKQLKERDSDNEEDKTDIGGIVMGYLEDPSKLAQIAGIVKMFVAGTAPLPAVAGVPAAAPAAVQGIGAVTPGADSAPVTDDETKLQRLAASLDILGAKDPQICEHLEKLAKLAQDDPGLFKAVISKLDLL